MVATDNQILRELGRRIARYRLNQDMTQEAFAKEAGVSKPTLVRIENGHSAQMVNMLRVLRTLSLLPNLDALIPPPSPSPVQQLKMSGKVRKRASGSRQRPPSDAEVKTGAWQWENEV